MSHLTIKTAPSLCLNRTIIRQQKPTRKQFLSRVFPRQCSAFLMFAQSMKIEGARCELHNVANKRNGACDHSRLRRHLWQLDTNRIKGANVKRVAVKRHKSEILTHSEINFSIYNKYRPSENFSLLKIL